MEESAPIRLVRIVWDNALKVTSHSWRRLNSSLMSALYLGITSGMKFGRYDLETIHNEFRGGYWMGDEESLYSKAIRSSNRSAAISCEQRMERKPFILSGGQRLHVGSQFYWNRSLVRLTSFHEEYIIACVTNYVDREKTLFKNILIGTAPNSCVSKVMKRCKLTRKDVKKAVAY